MVIGQVEIDNKDRPKTAFTTGEGFFEFKVMHFGLCNALAVFQRLMVSVGPLPRLHQKTLSLRGRHSRTLKNLIIVLERLRGAGL